MMNQSKRESDIRDRFALKLLLTDNTELNDQEVQYFKEHPEEIDEITAPVNVHKFFLWFGSLLGIGLVIFSKLIEIQTMVFSRSIHFKEVLVSIVFEIGVALIGGGVTAYLLGILLNNQQKKAVQWRQQIRDRISQSEE